MSISRNYFLFYKHFITHRTVLTFRQARIRTCRRDRFIDNNGMTVCGNYFLFYEYFAAYRAMFALRQTSFRTSRFYRIINYFRMTIRGNNFLFHNHCIADGAMLTFRQARIRTSRRYRFINDNSMTVCLDVFRVAITACRASICEHTFFRTCRLLGHFVHIVVRDHWDNLLFDEHFTTSGAMFAFRQACICASGFYRFIDNFCMRDHRNAFRIAVAADRAGVYHNAFTIARRLP